MYIHEEPITYVLSITPLSLSFKFGLAADLDVNILGENHIESNISKEIALGTHHLEEEEAGINDTPAGNGDNISTVRENNLGVTGTGSGTVGACEDIVNEKSVRPFRRTAAGVRVLTDAEISDNGYSDGNRELDGQEVGSSGHPPKRRRVNSSGRASSGQEQDEKAEKRDGKGMTGRFGGRLPSKEDEKRLNMECIQLGPYLSDDGELRKLPCIIRAMASGAVRKYLEKQQELYRNALEKICVLERSGSNEYLVHLNSRLSGLQQQLDLQRAHCVILEERLIRAGLSAKVDEQEKQQYISKIDSRPPENFQKTTSGLIVSSGLGAAAIPRGNDRGSVSALQSHNYRCTMNTASLPGLSHLVGVPIGTMPPSALGQMTALACEISKEEPPTTNPAHPGQQHILNVVGSNHGGLPQQAIAASHPSSMLRSFSANHLASTSDMQGVPNAMKREGSTVCLMNTFPSGELPNTVVSATTMTTLPSNNMGATLPSLSGAGGVPSVSNPQPSSNAEQDSAAVGGSNGTTEATVVAASTLAEQAQQLANQATLHAVAKSQATSEAQNLVVRANQHAQASVQAAQRAEDLKKSIADQPDSQAVVVVQSLEAQAQAHASMTTQVVEQARHAHSKAQAHEREQLKAFTQASVLQAHAKSLQVSAQQIEIAATTADQTLGREESSSLAGISKFQHQQPLTNVSVAPDVTMPTGILPASSGEIGNQDNRAGTLPTTPHSTASGTIHDIAGIMQAPNVPSSAANISSNVNSASAPLQALFQPSVTMAANTQLAHTMAAVLPPSIPAAPATAADVAAAVDSAILHQNVSTFNGGADHGSFQGAPVQPMAQTIGSAFLADSQTPDKGGTFHKAPSLSSVSLSNKMQHVAPNTSGSLPLGMAGTNAPELGFGNDSQSMVLNPVNTMEKQQISIRTLPALRNTGSTIENSEQHAENEMLECFRGASHVTAEGSIAHHENHADLLGIENNLNGVSLPPGSPDASLDLPNDILPERSQPLVNDPNMASSFVSMDPVVSLPPDLTRHSTGSPEKL